MLSWTRANAGGFLFAEPGVWYAGRLYDAIEIDGGPSVLVASSEAGVWLVTPSSATALSETWDAVWTRSLAHGPRGPQHFFVGGYDAVSAAALYQTDTTAAVPLSAPWLPMALDPGMTGGINRVVVDPSGERIVVATENGLWWAALPPDGSAPAFVQAVDASHGAVAGAFADVRFTASGQIVTVASGGGGVPAAFATGKWVGSDLVLTAAVPPPDVDPTGLVFVILAVAPSDGRRVYAACCSDAGAGTGAPAPFTALLRSGDGGQSWESAPAVNTGTGRLLEEHCQMIWAGTRVEALTGALAVSPTDPGTLILGYTGGPFVSRDSGSHFTRAASEGHDDKHSYLWTSAGRIYETSDGGLMYTDDLGATVHTELSRYIATFMFFGPRAIVGWGRAGASYQVPGLIAGGTQDNDNLWCLQQPDGTATPWRKCQPDLSLFDGSSILFLRTGGCLVGNAASFQPWEGSGFGAATLIPVRTARPGVDPTSAFPHGLVGGPVGIVNDPIWRRGGQLMYMVAAHVDDGATPADLYGLFADDAGGDLHWEFLTTLALASGQAVSAVNSGNGNHILVGLRGAPSVYVVDTADLGSPHVGTLPGGSTSWLSFVSDLVVQTDETGTLEAFATWADDGAATGAVHHTTNGVDWTALPGYSGVPAYALATDWTVLPNTLYVMGGSTVSVGTATGGRWDWSDGSTGLPRRLANTDLAFVVHPDGGRWLYLFTFGWSAWKAAVSG